MSERISHNALLGRVRNLIDEYGARLICRNLAAPLLGRVSWIVVFIHSSRGWHSVESTRKLFFVAIASSDVVRSSSRPIDVPRLILLLLNIRVVEAHDNLIVAFIVRIPGEVRGDTTLRCHLARFLLPLRILCNRWRVPLAKAAGHAAGAKVGTTVEVVETHLSLMVRIVSATGSHLDSRATLLVGWV